MVNSSDLRNRKGKAETQPLNGIEKDQVDVLRNFQEELYNTLLDKAKREGHGTTPEEITQAVAKDMAKLNKGPEKTAACKGIRETTMKAKDALAEDPYNLKLINALGTEYMSEEKWAEAGNVLVRGWKRVSEFEDPGASFEYLYQLCQCSLQCGKFKQAYAVLMDMEGLEKPVDPSDMRAYYILQCNVLGQNNELQKTLKAFHNGIEGAKFEEVLHVWTQTVISLRKAGADQAAKSSLERLATTEDEQKMLKVMHTMTELSENLQQSKTAKPSPIQNAVLIGLSAITLGAMIWLLHLMESESLQNLKLK